MPQATPVSRLTAAAAASALLVSLPASPASAAIELLINPAAGGALSLRATGAAAEDINGYSIFSAGGFLSDIGDETLGGLLSTIVFDVDNVGSDEVATWTLGPGGVLPPVSVPTAGNGLSLNLAWIGGLANPLTDLSFQYGPVGLTAPNGDPIFTLPGTIRVLAAAGLAGDYNNTGAVEQGDLDLVLNNWGGPRTAGFVANADGFATTNVDQEELDRVLNNWGSTSSPSFTGSAVPEPGAALIGLSGTAFLASRAGVRRRSAKSS